MDRRRLLLPILLLVVFLVGFVPEWFQARDAKAAREKAEHQLTLVRMVKDVGASAIDARRGEYEAARQEASAFFTAARFEVDQQDRSTLNAQQRDALSVALKQRDDLITLLARSDPASAERLSNLFVSVRKALGA